MTIPDLRVSIHDNITLDHCSVLLEKLRDVITIAEGSEEFSDIVNGVDTMEMLELFKELYQPPEFNRLFKSDLGKGVLIGVFTHAVLMTIEQEEEDFL